MRFGSRAHSSSGPGFLAKSLVKKVPPGGQKRKYGRQAGREEAN